MAIDIEAEEARNDKLIKEFSAYPGVKNVDLIVADSYLNDCMLHYDGETQESAANFTNVNGFLSYYFIERVITDIRIKQAAKSMLKFVDFLYTKELASDEEKNEISGLIQKSLPEYVRMEKDFETMDYDEYEDKSWGLGIL